MDLYRLTNETLEPVTEHGFMERDMQEIVENNLETLFSLEFVCSGLRVGASSIDTVAFDRKKRAFVIIEYKNDASDSVIGQGYSYFTLIAEHKRDFFIEYKERTNGKLRREDINWQNTRIFFVATDFSLPQKKSIEYEPKKHQFELWHIRRYGNNLVALERHTPSLSASSNELGELPKPPTKSTEKPLRKTNNKCKAAWKALKKEIVGLGDWKAIEIQNYITFGIGNRRLCYVYFFEDHFEIRIRRGGIKADGKYTKGYFTLKDRKKLAKTKKRKYYRNQDDLSVEYQIVVRNIDELNYVMSLVKQKDKSLKNSPKANRKLSGKSVESSKQRPASIGQRLEKTSRECRAVWKSLKKGIESLGDWQITKTQDYIAFGVGQKRLCFIRFSKDHLSIRIWRGGIKPDGTRTKGYFTWEDPRSLAETSQRRLRKDQDELIVDYRLKIRSIAELDYVMSLIKQKHLSFDSRSGRGIKVQSK